MEYSPGSNAGKEAIERAPLPPSTSSLSQTLQKLSIAASSTALPSSSQPSSPARTLPKQNSFDRTSSPNGRLPPRSPLHRSPSSMSQDTRSSTPTLHKKASMNSLHGIGNQQRAPSRASPSRRVGPVADVFLLRNPNSSIVFLHLVCERIYNGWEIAPFRNRR